MSDSLVTNVGRIGLRPPVRIPPVMSLRDAATTMRNEDISSLIVDTQPLSFLTERDLVRAMARGCLASDPVTVVATRAPVWVPPTVSVEHAAAIMVAYGLRHLVVVAASGDVVGVVSIRDALESLLVGSDGSAWLRALATPRADVG